MDRQLQREGRERTRQTDDMRIRIRRGAKEEERRVRVMSVSRWEGEGRQKAEDRGMMRGSLRPSAD
jgi:hypothetical protein